jgi:hypothetical protein
MLRWASFEIADTSMVFLPIEIGSFMHTLDSGGGEKEI